MRQNGAPQRACFQQVAGVRQDGAIGPCQATISCGMLVGERKMLGGEMAWNVQGGGHERRRGHDDHH